MANIQKVVAVKRGSDAQRSVRLLSVDGQVLEVERFGPRCWMTALRSGVSYPMDDRHGRPAVVPLATAGVLVSSPGEAAELWEAELQAAASAAEA